MMTQEQISPSIRSAAGAQVIGERPAPVRSLISRRPAERLENMLMLVHGHRAAILRVSMALVFIWFGGLKIFGMSPAYGLVEQTVFWFPAMIFVPILGLAEVLIGLSLAYGRHMRWVLALLAGHMLATFSPFLIVPGVCFESFPFELTLEGQYIVKNLVFVAVGMVLASDRLVRLRADSKTPL